MTEGVEDLSPEPWGYHLLGLISPSLVITGNLLGGAYTLLGVIFIWGVGPLLDVIMGQSKTAKPPRDSGKPFIALLWAHGVVHFIMLGSFFVFAYGEGLTMPAALVCGHRIYIN